MGTPCTKDEAARRLLPIIRGIEERVARETAEAKAKAESEQGSAA